MIGISRKYADRISADAEETLRGMKFPANQARELRKYILERAEILATTEAETTRADWKKRRAESQRIAKEAAAETEVWHENISENASLLWGDANLGFLSRILNFADKENGPNLSQYVIQGVPQHAVFPRTCLFEPFTEDELEKHAKKQKEAAAKFKVKERSELPNWVAKEEMAAAFLSFMAKARNPIEVFCAFADLIDPVF